jgi:hypothetical protein
MPTYSIHHFSAYAAKPDRRPRGAKRIALAVRKADARRRPVRRAA